MAYGTLTSDPIILGSGELYLGKVAEGATDAVIDAALSNVGYIESGATLNYKPTTKDIETANRGTIMSYITKEDVSFKTGIISWKIENLALLAPATVTTDATKKTKKVVVGGKGSLPVNYLRFVHTKDDGKKLIVNIYKTQQTSGFELNFDKEKPLSLNYEFKALASADGSLVEIIEEFDSIS